jgi:hypothetical protein
MLAKEASDDQIVSLLYVRAYARAPSPTELANAREFLAGEQQAGRPRRRALEGLMWSVLNSKEFQLNH